MEEKDIRLIDKDEDKGLIVFDLNFHSVTAGPSPDGVRVELFLFGCNKAMSGNPCPGCFNRMIWDSSIATCAVHGDDLADYIAERTGNDKKYISIVGGEPLDQIKNLIPFCKRLKDYGFHIIIFTWREVKRILSNKNEFHNDFLNLIQYVDIVIDGEFFKEESDRFDEQSCDGLFSAVGSENQIIWDISTMEGHAMRELDGIYLDENDRLVFKLKED